jgi:hypothetical protein
VPSFLHEFLVDLFRRCGELAPELLRCCAGIGLAHEQAEEGSIDLSQVTSPGFRADSVVKLYGAQHVLSCAVIVEVQLGIDPVKRRSWPAYVAGLRAELGCPVVLLVISNDRTVVRWARRSIELGHPGFRLVPIVLGFEDLPRVVDPVTARKLPQLAVLSSMAHRELEVAETALEAIADLPEDLNRLYLDVILTELPDHLRQILEDRMQRHEYEAEFAHRHYAQGVRVGREEGREEGRAEGLRAAVLAFARVRLAPLSPDDVAAISGLCDERELTELVDTLAQAESVAAARAVLDAAIDGTRK